MIKSVLDYMKNHFLRSCENIELVFAADKTITGTFAETYLAGQYIQVVDSILNDAVYKIASVTGDPITQITVEETLIAETATPFFFGLGVPANVISLIADITTWQTEFETTQGLTSEKIDDYSANFGVGVQTGGWQSAFRGQLATYAKAFCDIEWWIRRRFRRNYGYF
jgi:hypothetical protein